MASIISRITAILSLNQRDYRSGLQQAGASAKAFGKILAGVAAGAGIKSVFSAAAGRESLLRGLAATSDGLRTTTEQFARLQDVAARTAQGVDEIALRFSQLRSAGMSADQAEKTIYGVANALNRIGRGSELQMAMQNFVQMAGAAIVAQDEVKEIANYLPDIRMLSKLRFGTDRGEELTARGITGREFVVGITEEYLKLENASDGAAAAVSKFSAAFENLKVAAGNWILPAGTAALNSVAEGMDMFSQDATRWLGEAKEALKEFKRESVGTDLGWAAGKALEFLGPDAKPEDLEKKKREEAERVAQLEAKRLEDIEKAAQKEFELGSANRRLAEAEAAQDDDAIRRAKEELAILKDRQDLMKSMNATEAEAVEMIRERVRMEIAAANVQRNLERAKNRLKNADDLEMLEGRAQGFSQRRLRRMEKKRRLNDETERLRQMGFSPEAAFELADRRIKAEDDIERNEDRASRGLRPRIRSFRGDTALRRRWSRMSDAQKERYASVGLNESTEHPGAETGYEVFRRKERGGIDAHRGDERMGERRNRPKQAETGRASEGQVSRDEAMLREMQQINKNIQALTQPSDRLKPRR